MKFPKRCKIKMNLVVLKLKPKKEKKKGKKKKSESFFMGRQREIPVLRCIWKDSGRKGACYLAKYV